MNSTIILKQDAINITLPYPTSVSQVVLPINDPSVNLTMDINDIPTIVHLEDTIQVQATINYTLGAMLRYQTLVPAADVLTLDDMDNQALDQIENQYVEIS